MILNAALQTNLNQARHSTSGAGWQMVDGIRVVTGNARMEDALLVLVARLIVWREACHRQFRFFKM